MIIVRLKGGLGNQLFQYAVGRHLALRNATSLKLDLSSFRRNKLRGFRLDPYDIVATAASPADLRRFGARQLKRVRRAVRVVRRWLPYNDWQWIVGHGPSFDPTVLEARGNVYLEGTFQSHKYFADIAPFIRQELTLREAPSAPTCRIAEEIASTSAISLHIRRGDYATDPATLRRHGLCDLGYYAAAMDIVAQEVNNPHFFVFSDDPHWARRNLVSEHPMTVVDHNGPDADHEDLFLLTMCRHHVIANSTFSWWGAWLSPAPDKIVIAPSHWFRSAPLSRADDLVPPTWRRVSALLG